MTEVGIPVYKARDTLPNALDSLVAQTKKMFLVCLSIDGDGEDYSDIINEYERRGLHIRVINSKENGGPGMARQRILDTTQCEYLMYLDADDMLMPRAVEVLTRNIRVNDMDIIRSSIIREEKGADDKLIQQNINTITWFHGKIYRVKFLKDNNIRFLDGLRTDEDAYFNVIAWNSTKNRGELSEITYLWRFNENSITRSKEHIEYFINTCSEYIHSQVEGMKKIYEIKQEIPDILVSTTLQNLYYYYMKAKTVNVDLTEMESHLMSLRDEIWLQIFFKKIENWREIVNNIKTGFPYEDNKVVFFTETFNLWADRLLIKHE